MIWPPPSRQRTRPPVATVTSADDDLAAFGSPLCWLFSCRRCGLDCPGSVGDDRGQLLQAAINLIHR
ncbi:hypothetical protein ACVI1I_006265 [Bradyrhizobium sp. USDA 4459]